MIYIIMESDKWGVDILPKEAWTNCNIASSRVLELNKKEEEKGSDYEYFVESIKIDEKTI